MAEKIERSLQAKLNGCNNKIFPYADLNMKNGDEVTVYAPSNWLYGDKDYSILTDRNEVIHFQNLSDVSNWIVSAYCN